LTNGSDRDAELIRVANDMRMGNEQLEPAVADRVYWVYTLHYGPNVRAQPVIDVPPADLAATYEWVVDASPSAQRSGMSATIRDTLRAAAERR
jgi:hypothetical protein